MTVPHRAYLAVVFLLLVGSFVLVENSGVARGGVVAAGIAIAIREFSGAGAQRKATRKAS